ncbi:hypothetical protein HanPSC8_Chr14g0629321 [Helianthus annuus]|nr:hypothetical protein HanPSC8_Chr14g0629321 [Helianthus annuus]
MIRRKGVGVVPPRLWLISHVAHCPLGARHVASGCFRTFETIQKVGAPLIVCIVL